ncbi:MAG: hypothetical protein IKI97_12145 [Clostridia bacterium]|nr:hypothetical protein [Clostridia bacterium]
MLAVKAGYVFNLFEEENLKGIELKKTDTKVKVDGVEYSLYAGATYEDSRRIDDLLDMYGEKRTNAFLVRDKGDTFQER